MFTEFKFNPAHQKSALYLEKQKSLKNSAKCALCSANCALCSNVRSDLSAPFKPPAQKKLMLKISEKSVEKQRKCAQISPRAFLSIAPNFKKKKFVKSQLSLLDFHHLTVFF
jgi:hypothetical protein